MNNKQTLFEQHVQQLIDTSVENIDAKTQSDLTQARNKALVQTANKKWGILGILVPTMAVVMLLITLMPISKQQSELLPTQYILELTTISEMEDLDLYINIEFYQWLDKADFNS